MKIQKLNLVLFMALMGLSLVVLPRTAGAEDQPSAGGAAVQGMSDIKEDKQDIKADKRKLHHERKKHRHELRKVRKDLQKHRRDLRRDRRKKHLEAKDSDQTQSSAETQPKAQP